MRKIRVGMRGVAGLLGSRLAAAIARTSDISLEIGTVIPDASLTRMLSRMDLLRGQNILPKEIFLDCPKHMGNTADVVRKLNKEQSHIHFRMASQICWHKSCDVIVDTAYPAGDKSLEQMYHGFRGPILLQDGAAPHGTLVVPPYREQGMGNVFRMGGCIISALLPVISPLQELVSSVRVTNVLTQYDGVEKDYLLQERTQALYIREDLRESVESSLRLMLPDAEVSVSSVVQIPSIPHYQATIEFELAEKITGDELRTRYSNAPHVMLAPPGVMSTYDINLARYFGEMPPLLIFDGALTPERGKTSRTVRICMAIHYRAAVVLPNLDAIRILAQHMSPMAAMRQTDKDMGFSRIGTTNE
jgi:hypothetical protein